MMPLVALKIQCIEQYLEVNVVYWQGVTFTLAHIHARRF